ncbi:MAG: hypothetical protein KatS3mg007_0023 [Thermoanaerobaculum sp.]|nr:MAG: hypothetical protein KatS3mg007_0023 [Thermoanaerobaculum sp.]
MQVLVADDSRIFRVLVKELLEEKGVTVFEAADGKQALDAALAYRPELLILDALMPRLSGFDVIAKLKEKLHEYQPKVFIVTAVYKSYRWESEARDGLQGGRVFGKTLGTRNPAGRSPPPLPWGKLLSLYASSSFCILRRAASMAWRMASTSFTPWAKERKAGAGLLAGSRAPLSLTAS